MEKETVIEVVEKLTGSCYPYGSTEIDKERYENLELKEALFTYLLEEIAEAAKFKDRPEYSIKEIGIEAYDYLKDKHEYLKEYFEEEEEEAEEWLWIKQDM